MKKFLLLAVAVLTVGAASAQITNKRGKAVKVNSFSVQQKKQSELKALTVTPMKDTPAISKKKQAKLLSKQFRPAELNNIKANENLLSAGNSGSSRAGELQAEYTGSGVVTGNGTAPWKMLSGTTSEGTLVLADVIPNPYQGQLSEIAVEYTLVENIITIQPQLVFSTSSWYGFIFDALNDDGHIELTLGEDGSLTLPEGEIIYYGAFSSDKFDPTLETYKGYIEYVNNIKYTLPGQIVAPTVEYNPEGLYLHANVSQSFYGYSKADFAMVPAYSSVNLLNGTTDVADSWNWSISTAVDEGETPETQTGTNRDFSFQTTAEVYTPAQLIGYNQEAASDPYVLGTAHGVKTSAYIFAGDYEGSYDFSDGTYATMTLANTDNDLSYFSGFATPDQNSQRSINSLVFYQAKPNAPLYIEGISLSVSKFNITDPANFNLKCKILKVTMESDGWPVFGDVIAEADLTADNVVEGYSGEPYTMTKLSWNDFYVMDELGLSQSIDHLFLEDEFAVVIEGWDNGTFSCAHTWGEYYANAQAAASSFYIQTGDEFNDDNLYRLPYKQRQLIGFLGATYGYLHTTDETNVTIPVTGGQASIHVEPMFSNSEDAETQTRLYLDDTVENNEIPDWLTVGFANEVYTDTGASFDLVFEAEALPEGVDGRDATLVFFQEGAKLEVTVTQGTTNGIHAVVTSAKSANAPAYNLAGQRVNSTFKGLVVKGGKKFVIK